MGRSWPDVSTASRPVVGLGTPVPPLPRRERAAATSSRETGRILLEDRPRPLRPALDRASREPMSVPSPRTATADPEHDDSALNEAALAALTRTRLGRAAGGAGPAEHGGTEHDGTERGGTEREDQAQADHLDAAVARRPRRRLPSAPSRRPALLLVALVVGALIAALPGGARSTPAVEGSGSDFGLGVASDAGFAGDVDLTSARGEISQAEAEARLSEIAASRAAREPDFALPLAGRETTCFCTRWGQFHPGLDIAAPLGTPIVSASDGVVLRAGRASGFGYAIYIQDTEGNVQIYGHMRYLFVEAGQTVRAGDLIAKVGNEGFSTGPHLHFQIHRGGINGRAIDPAAWFAEREIPY